MKDFNPNSTFIYIVAVNAIMATVCCKLLPDKIYPKNHKFYSPSKKECKI